MALSIRKRRHGGFLLCGRPPGYAHSLRLGHEDRGVLEECRMAYNRADKSTTDRGSLVSEILSEPRVVSEAEEGAADSPVFVRVERWSDGSMFFEGPGGTLDFARLRRNNQADAARWLERAARLFALVKEDR